jgi:hypothetical protein
MVKVCIVLMTENSAVVIKETAFCLQVEKMKSIEEVERNCGAGSIPCCRYPELAKDLFYTSVPWLVSLTVAILDLQDMLSIAMNDGELSKKWGGMLAGGSA